MALALVGRLVQMPVDPGKEYDYQKDECKDDEYPASNG
jgi:hypothetical protein